MDILIITLFVSLLLVALGLVLFVLRLGAGDFEHADRLSLLPLLDQEEQREPTDSFAERSAQASASPGHPSGR